MPTEKEEHPNTNQTAENVEKKASITTQKAYGDFLGVYKSFSETTSKVVQQAASILEDELATGIKFANQTESNFPQIERFRSEKPDEIMQRFRRDAHEVVDIFTDIFGATLKSVPNLGNLNAMRDGSVIVKPVHNSTAQRPILMPTHAIAAGKKAEISMSLENSLTVATEELNFYSTDLVSNSGKRLPSNSIRFTPQSLKIGPRLTEQITITIAIPEETKPGTYSGLVLASNMPQLRSEIVVTVE
jgi:hypothetical protein